MRQAVVAACGPAGQRRMGRERRPPLPIVCEGWDPHARKWVERIYYAGAAENLWGPYTIGYLEWDGASGWISAPGIRGQ